MVLIRRGGRQAADSIAAVQDGGGLASGAGDGGGAGVAFEPAGVGEPVLSSPISASTRTPAGDAACYLHRSCGNRNCRDTRW